MIAGRLRTKSRRGVTLVETAMVLSVALFLLFSVYEWGRYIMMQQLVENAAREGARYAVVNTATATTAQVQAQATTYLCGLDSQVQNFQVSVSGVALQTGPVYTQGQTFADWTQASPTDGIIVTVSGTYTPDRPTLQFLPQVLVPGFQGRSNGVTLTATSVMYSEGN